MDPLAVAGPTSEVHREDLIKEDSSLHRRERPHVYLGLTEPST